MLEEQIKAMNKHQQTMVASAQGAAISLQPVTTGVVHSTHQPGKELKQKYTPSNQNNAQTSAHGTENKENALYQNSSLLVTPIQ